ncbi:uncharacterized protein [Panulirus ornatus]|uniref:uncharacterized protein isoform X1 n=2 Tax=Panulirus ornatus TaxID=150431 RepID=UPI003A887944
MGVQQPPLATKPKGPKPVSEARRIRKPLMERKRRERINTSLNDLATLLAEAHMVKTEAGKPTKLEKADILELTVKHIKTLKTQTDAEPDADGEGVSPTSSYKEGFSRCMGVVEQALGKAGKEALRERLLTHLQTCLQSLQPPTPHPDADDTHLPSKDASERLSGAPVTPAVKSEGSTSREGGPRLTLVPTRLPTGGVAFLVQGGIDPSLLLPQDCKVGLAKPSPSSCASQCQADPSSSPSEPSVVTSTAATQCSNTSSTTSTSASLPTQCPPTTTTKPTQCQPTTTTKPTQCPPTSTTKPIQGQPTTTTQCSPTTTSLLTKCSPNSTSMSTQCPPVPPTSTQCSSSPIATQCPPTPPLSTQCPPTPPLSTQCPPTPPLSTQCLPTPPLSTQCPPTPPISTHCPPTSPISTHCPPTPPISTQCPPTPPLSTQCPPTPPLSTQCPLTPPEFPQCPPTPPISTQYPPTPLISTQSSSTSTLASTQYPPSSTNHSTSTHIHPVPTHLYPHPVFIHRHTHTASSRPKGIIRPGTTLTLRDDLLQPRPSRPHPTHAPAQRLATDAPPPPMPATGGV